MSEKDINLRRENALRESYEHNGFRIRTRNPEWPHCSTRRQEHGISMGEAILALGAQDVLVWYDEYEDYMCVDFWLEGATYRLRVYKVYALEKNGCQEFIHGKSFQGIEQVLSFFYQKRHRLWAAPAAGCPASKAELMLLRLYHGKLVDYGEKNGVKQFYVENPESGQHLYLGEALPDMERDEFIRWVENALEPWQFAEYRRRLRRQITLDPELGKDEQIAEEERRMMCATLQERLAALKCLEF